MVCGGGIKSRIQPWSEVDPLAMPRIGTKGKMNLLRFSPSLFRVTTVQPEGLFGAAPERAGHGP